MKAVLPGRVLRLTADPEGVRQQLSRVDPGPRVSALADDVSTDEMTPAWACFYFDQRLAEYCLTGFRGGVIGPGAIRSGDFSVLVAGEGLGCGSSRETAPFAQRACGIRLVIARSFEHTYRRNCHNLGLFTSTDLDLAARIEVGDLPEVEELVRGLDPVSRAVVLAGGLPAHEGGQRVGARREGLEPRSAMTRVERILGAHAVWDPGSEAPPIATPGRTLRVRADVRFCHDYTTAMIDAQMRDAFGEDVPIRHPESVFVFRDHLNLLPQVMPERHRRLGLLEQAGELSAVQRRFAERHGLRLFDPDVSRTSGICHNVVVEELAEPGQVVVGTDSHTLTAGVLGCVAFGVGSTEMACGLVTETFQVRVPESVRIELRGRLSPLSCAKDAWLALLARDDVRNGILRGRALELTGEGLLGLSFDERTTLTNMAAEAGAFTVIAPVDEIVLSFLEEERGMSDARSRFFEAAPGPDARYAAELVLDLDSVRPMLALPHSPKNGVPLDRFREEAGDVPIDIAYGGSCTGGKRADMDLYARVLRGRRVAPGVELFIQFGSQAVRRYADERGHTEVFRAAGAVLLDPACGACIAAGPGVSHRPEQVTVSAINRNFPGRSGPGQVYLASPLVVAASAVAGKIASPETVLGESGASV